MSDPENRTEQPVESSIAEPNTAESTPVDSEPTLESVQKLISEGKATDAIELLNPMIDQVGAKKNQLYLADLLRWRGIAFFCLQNFHNACRDFTVSLKANPNNAETLYNLGVVTEQMEEGEQTALKCYTRALELAPDYLDCYYNRGNLYLRLEKIAKAISDYTSVIQLDPQMTAAWNNRGNAKIDLCDYYGALMDFEEVIRLNPERDNAYTNRGYAKEMLGDLAGAMADYNHELDLHPQNSAALANHARLLPQMPDEKPRA